MESLTKKTDEDNMAEQKLKLVELENDQSEKQSFPILPFE